MSSTKTMFLWQPTGLYNDEVSMIQYGICGIWFVKSLMPRFSMMPCRCSMIINHSATGESTLSWKVDTCALSYFGRQTEHLLHSSVVWVSPPEAKTETETTLRHTHTQSCQTNWCNHSLKNHKSSPHAHLLVHTHCPTNAQTNPCTATNTANDHRCNKDCVAYQTSVPTSCPLGRCCWKWRCLLGSVSWRKP